MPNPSVTIDLKARMKEAQAAFNKLGARVRQFATRTGAVLQKWARRITVVGIGLGGYFVKLAADQQRAVTTMEAALRSNGEAVEVWSQRLQQAASALQSVTTYGDETLLPLMALGLNMGIAADRIDDATKAAIGLSTAFGIDLEQAMKMVALANQGEYTMMERYIPLLRTATDETEKARIAHEAMAKGFEQAQAQAKDSAGRMKQLMNTLGDLGEQIGAKLLPLLDKFVTIVDGLSRTISTKTIVTFGKWTLGIAAAILVVPKLVAAIQAICTAMTTMWSLSGPSGWAVLATGAAIAAAGILELKRRFDQMTESAEAAATAARRAAEAAAEGGVGMGAKAGADIGNLEMAISKQKSINELDRERVYWLKQFIEAQRAAGRTESFYTKQTKELREYQEFLKEGEQELARLEKQVEGLKRKRTERGWETVKGRVGGEIKGALIGARAQFRPIAAIARWEWALFQKELQRKTEARKNAEETVAKFRAGIEAKLGLIPEHRATFVGLAEMQRKIQAGAGSRSPEERQARLLKQQVDRLGSIDKYVQKLAKEQVLLVAGK